MRNRAVLIFTVLAAVLGPLAAQSNDRIDELLGQAPARWDSAAYLVLTSVAAIPESATLAEAFQAAVAKGLAAPDRKAGDPVTVQDLSFLLMKARKVPGGWEWSLMPSARMAPLSWRTRSTPSYNSMDPSLRTRDIMLERK